MRALRGRERRKAVGLQWCSFVQVRDVLKLIRDDGWYHVRTVGSHRQFRHPTKSGKVTVAGHPAMELHPQTLKSILRQAGLGERE